MEKTIGLLRNFDFNESEAKAYIYLYQQGPCSGYELSKISGIPRSKIYNILEILFKKGYITNTQDGKALIYKAEPMEHITRLIRNKSEDNIGLLLDQMTYFEKAVDNEQIWNIEGHENIINKCLDLIERSEKEILIQVWADDLTEYLEEAIIKKQNDLSRVLVILYDTKNLYDTKIKEFYKHRFEKYKIADTGGRWISLTVDSNEMLHAYINNHNNAEGVYTKNAGMVFFANEYIIHDAYCLRLIDALGDKAKDVFGEDMEGVRDVFAIN